MVSNDIFLIDLVNLVHPIQTLCIANDHQRLVDAFSESVEMGTLLINFESEIF